MTVFRNNNCSHIDENVYNIDEKAFLTIFDYL